MEAGAAMVVMIQRAFPVVGRFIVRMAALAIVMLMGANLMCSPGGEDAGTQSGENAEDQKPCQEETHDGFSDRRRWGKFK